MNEKRAGLSNIIAGATSGSVRVLANLIVLLNIFSWVIGGIWLAIQGAWPVIGLGFVLSIAMPFVYSLLSIPSTWLILSAVKGVEKGNSTIAAVFSFLSSVIVQGLIASWVIYVYTSFANYSGQYPWVALLLWGYAVMMAPLSYMASKEDSNSIGTNTALFFSGALFLFIFTISLFGLGTVIVPAIAVFIVVYSAWTSHIFASSTKEDK